MRRLITFIDCTFVIQGSIPYGYTDYYGKGGPNFGLLNKHCFMSVSGARNTDLVNCKVYMQSFGHCLHFHGADGVLIQNCRIENVGPVEDRGSGNIIIELQPE